MQAARELVVDEVDPNTAFQSLNTAQSAALVDVRSRAEWALDGLPDISETKKPLWLIEWVSAPSMTVNPRFLDQLTDQADGDLPDHLYFICRSGARSMYAARMVAAVCAENGKTVQCTNVAEGMEGDLHPGWQRGPGNGWKARGLPWQLS